MSQLVPNQLKVPRPTGTITFLFTDIEGSTRLWELEREQMAAALARHDYLLHDCIKTGGGHIVKTTGDGVLAAFSTAHDAVNVSIQVQLALHVETWPTSTQLRVRMGLHTGVAEMRDGDYFGPSLNRAARLMSLGHGGQILLSQSTQDLCRDLLPAGVSLINLGHHHLKGLSRPETVFQLCCDGLNSSFPALRNPLVPIVEETPSIAVLPFADMSQAGDCEYFADGLAEELLNVLARIRGLRVASRTSAFSFKGKHIDIPTIARQLKVETVLEGSVRTSGTRIRVTAQLIQVESDSHLWSKSYDRDLEDIFAVQDDIAQSVVGELRVALLGEPRDDALTAQVQTAGRGRGRNAVAYQLYLQGSYFANRMKPGDIHKAINYYEEAVKLSDDFSLAWAGYSRACVLAANRSEMPLEQGFDLARAAAQRAVALEPALAEAHLALAGVLMYRDWDWVGAEREVNMALTLAPGSAEVLARAALLRGYLGNQQEALALNRQALILDPLSSSNYRNLAWHCLNAGLLDEAEKAVEKLRELSSDGEFVHYFQGNIHLVRDQAEAARAEYQQEFRENYRLLGLTMALHSSGQHADSDAMLSELIGKHAGHSAFEISAALAYRGKANQAFEWLYRAIEQRDPGLCQLASAFHFRSLHADTRWQVLLRKLGFARSNDKAR